MRILPHTMPSTFYQKYNLLFTKHHTVDVGCNIYIDVIPYVIFYHSTKLKRTKSLILNIFFLNLFFVLRKNI